MDRTLSIVLVIAAALALAYGASLGSAEPPSPPPAPAAPPPAPAAATPATGGELEWATLTAYDYQPGLAGLPDALRALDGKRVVLRGFLMPLTEFDDIHEFALVGTHMSCCFGVPPGLSGQVLVRLRTARGLPNTNEPLEVVGTFRVEEIKEQGFVLAIFSVLEAEARIVGY